MKYVESDFETPLVLTTGTHYTVKLLDPAAIGHLHIQVFNQIGKSILPGLSYELEGGDHAFSGSTDEHGVIRHLKVTSGYYSLRIDSQEFPVPTVNDPEELHAVFVAVEPSPLQGAEDEEELPAEILGTDSEPESDLDPETDPE
jgi:hypothetical protein